jgi:hypothetical protein
MGSNYFYSLGMVYVIVHISDFNIANKVTRGTRMIDKNGTFTFYKIQHLQKDGKWVYSNFDYFCNGLKLNEPYRSFTAIGKCWQEIGEQGCYNLSTGLLFLEQISQAWSNYQFRLVKIRITQKTTVEVKSHGKKS